jgi:hypothetical protein
MRQDNPHGPLEWSSERVVIMRHISKIDDPSGDQLARSGGFGNRFPSHRDHVRFREWGAPL